MRPAVPPRTLLIKINISWFLIQAKGARLVSVASVRGCKLDLLADACVHLPLERELCPFDLAPVTSTAIQMLFGDTVAIALMQVGQLGSGVWA